MKKFLTNKQMWGTIIAIVLLAFCLKDIRLSELQDLSQRVNYYYLIPATLASFVFIIFRALRWRMMIVRQMELPYVRGVCLYSAGQVLNIVMPVLTGQVGRLFLFSKKLALRKTFIFSTIVLEILFDALSLIIFIFFTSLAFAFPEEYRFLSYILAGATALLLAILYLITTYQARIEELARRKMAHRWPGVYIGAKKFVRSFTKGIMLIRSSQHMAGQVVYSLASWTAHMLVIWFLYESFGFELPIAAAAAIMIINSIVLMVPLTPGNAGTFEFAVSTSLAAFSIGRTDAVLFALALHLMDLLPIIVMGAIFFRIEKISLRELKAKASEQQAEPSIIDALSDSDECVEKEKV
ncbi:MAG: flippase-like domain-containing protein [candidate division Zixibacteria bacterium]|nr:flippase-like domain-containing protein [candidate division Zixibacteria bacterium]